MTGRDTQFVFSGKSLMAIKALNLSEFRSLSDEERLRRIKSFTASRTRPANGGSEFLASRIAEFEQQYEMSSATMLGLLNRGEFRETADVCLWLMLLKARDCLSGKAG